jgi:hypothetical protein
VCLAVGHLALGAVGTPPCCAAVAAAVRDPPLRAGGAGAFGAAGAAARDALPGGGVLLARLRFRVGRVSRTDLLCVYLRSPMIQQ